MNMLEVITRSGGASAIAEQLGISESQATNGVEALLPSILGGFKKSTQQFGGGQDGLGSLLALAQAAGGAGLFDNVLGKEPTDINAGNGILGQIFGSKDVSRSVASHAAEQSGLDSSLLKKMLPIVTMLVAGYMTRSSDPNPSEGGLGDVLGSLLGGGGQQSGGLGGLVGGLFGGGSSSGSGSLLGGLSDMLDLNNDGNPLDDILGMANAIGRGLGK
jgi:hypothetical protein